MILEDPDGAPYPEPVQAMWDHIEDIAVTITREPTRETVVAALESVVVRGTDRAEDFEGRYEVAHDARMVAERALERAEAAIRRVRAVHVHHQSTDGSFCLGCWATSPCPTILALEEPK